jgi:hypothetical protein
MEITSIDNRQKKWKNKENKKEKQIIHKAYGKTMRNRYCLLS